MTPLKVLRETARSSSRIPSRQLSALASLLLLLGLLAACDGQENGAGEQNGVVTEQSTAQLYRIRAEVRNLPVPDRASPELMVRHEAVDDWVDPTGAVVGMDSMTMPFPLESEAVADGFAVGDLVEMTVKVDWDGQRPVLVTAVEPLPEGAQLHFGPAGQDEPQAPSEETPDQETPDQETSGEKAPDEPAP